jgi:hypothetical protein
MALAAAAVLQHTAAATHWLQNTPFLKQCLLCISAQRQQQGGRANKAMTTQLPSD